MLSRGRQCKLPRLSVNFHEAEIEEKYTTEATKESGLWFRKAQGPKHCIIVSMVIKGMHSKHYE